VLGQIHRVVENAHDFDHLTSGGAVHDEMPSAPAFAGDVQAAQAALDFIARGAALDVGSCMQRRQRLRQRRLINPDLPLAERIGGLAQDAGEVGLSFVAKPYTPLRHVYCVPAAAGL
jgi:hypothetical protein